MKKKQKEPVEVYIQLDAHAYVQNEEQNNFKKKPNTKRHP